MKLDFEENEMMILMVAQAKCVCRESNPGLLLGRQLSNRWTTNAFVVQLLSYSYLSNLLGLGKAWLDPNGFSELSRHLTCPASIEPMQRWSQVSSYTGASHHWTFILVDGSSPDVEMIKRKRCIELVQLIMHLGPHDWKMTST
ncbi:hypothetical protein OIU77_022229 [Salix suchowensis]|uniref:Uncharacterized protein n=1 Tax=Salix suchowensis TaxID=1278906 RepID=A0ABQ9BZG5_9ROSI|nr:hypothetical protein OIU77_022229 [Salix suchowensis]